MSKSWESYLQKMRHFILKNTMSHSPKKRNTFIITKPKSKKKLLEILAIFISQSKEYIQYPHSLLCHSFRLALALQASRHRQIRLQIFGTIRH